MKIAVVIPKYGLVGGAEGFSYEVTERLAAHSGFEIHVFANQWLRGNPSISFHKVRILAFPRFMRQISFAYISNRLICTEKFDLIHSHDRIFKMDLFTMHGIPHKTWIKKVRHKHLSLFDRSMAWVEKKGIMGSHKPVILPVSRLAKREFLKVYNIPESNIHVIHPGISMDRFSALDKKACRYEIRGRHGLSQNDVVILFAGMNFKVKGLELVLRGFAGLIEREDKKSKLKMLVVGKGKKKRYIALCRELGIADRIIFTGVIRGVEKYYLASDIFAMPSQFDTFGLTVLEAMTAGLPVIISNRVGAMDLIDSGVQGFILSENPSPSDMTAALASLMKKEDRLEMGKNAQQTALQNTWDKTADQVANLYHQFHEWRTR